MLSKSAPPPRRTHRKRLSVSRLSADTTSTLPEYHQATTSTHSWQRQLSIEQDIPSDKPPDYPDSAEEADEDTDSEDHRNTLFVHPLPTGTSTLLRTPYTAGASPRRKQRHKRKHSLPPLGLGLEPSTDPYLDSLLERSVHALEMSNTLLQSSITTKTTLSTLMTTDSPVDHTLETRALNLSARINGTWGVQESWADDLEEITKRVNGLFGDESAGGIQETGPDKFRWSRHQHSSFEGGLSSSLPFDSPLQQRQEQQQQRSSKLRRPSLDLRQANSEPAGSAGLRLSYRTREELIAPPPRALTQYVESGADPAFITLPSTLGLRSNVSMHPNSDWNASTTSLHSSPALPVVTDTPLESSSTPAYTKLASFVIKRPPPASPSTPSSSFTSSFTIRRRNSSADGGRCRSSPLSSPRKVFDSPRTATTTQPGTPLPITHRPMTPPVEESSSSDSCVAKQTIVSLRKILDEQPIPEDAKSVASSSSHKRPQVFMPRTPAPAPVSGTSTATASISKMLTKKVHHSSTRPPSPPRQSALKGSRPATPSPTTATLTIPDLLSGVRSQSAPSSGRSTPKRISFAELPEAHVSSHPEKFKDKGKKKKGKGRTSKGSGKEEEEIGTGWLSGWFGASGGSLGLARHEQRMEDKMNRSWGGRMGGGYMDEWAV